MASLAQIGPFEIESQIGRGTMGVVYRARHRETAVPVAIKVIGREVDESSKQTFNREVQAHAELIHPGIAYLYEYGTVDRDEAGNLPRRIPEGAPYIAMEFARRGTVRESMPFSGWGPVRDLLVQVLDALAYAHARGVVHRDLKPANLLVFDRDGPESGELRVKLADFGLAHAIGLESLRDTDQLASPAGTPNYMAPEQYRGNWRAYGPWTDLYALGCVAWTLVCGEPPFQADSFVAYAFKHETKERPPLDAMFPVPEGLESWLHCAMDPEPEGRFRRAADALWALPTGERPGSAHPERETTDADSDPDFAEAPTLPAMNTGEPSETLTPTLPPTISLETADQTIPEAESAPERSPDSAPGGLHPPGSTDASIPPIPESWRTQRNESLPVPLVDTGLGLFGLREPPFVDRVNERDRIWELLRDVEQSGEPRVLLVTGASGVGKSRLVEWMATRAHELGAAGTLRAMHTSGEETAIEGIRAMARRMFRAQKLDRRETYEHLLDVLPPLADGSVDRETDARALTELLHPTPGDQSVDGPRYRFSSAGQKHALIARLLRRFSRRRPVFVWLDDAQWGPAAIDFAEYLLQNSLEQPSSFVAVTLRSDVLVEDASLEQRVEALLSHDGCSRLHLDPLADAHHRTFVQRLLPLQSRLLERISEKTEGNALFARQLVGHLVDRERLEATPEGFRIREEASLTLPEDIHALWMQRLSRFVDARRHGSRDSVWAALERAAALGREVASEEWCALWKSLQLEEPEAAVDDLAERGLAERTDEGWSFTHGMLVDSLERRSRERGSWKAHHRACVELLEAVHSDRPVRTAARRAEHCIEAGEFERALEPLLRESTRLRRSGETSAVRRVLEKREELLETLEIDRADPRRIQNDIRLAHARFESGEPPEGELDSVRDALRRAEREEFDALTADACRVAGNLTQALNRYERVRHFLKRGVNVARAASATALLSTNLRKLGWVECESGNLDRSDELHSEALEAALRTDNPYLPAATRRNMAWVALSRGERDRSRQLFEEVLEESREAGLRALELPCLNGLGELAKFDGAAESARSYYRRFQRLARELDRPASLAVCYLNLGQVDLLAGDCGSAAHSIRRADSRLEELGQRDQFARSLDFARLARAACAGDWRRFDEILERQLGEKDDVRIVKDHPWLVEMAGDFCVTKHAV